jgi:hypothetical protein
LTIFSTTSAQGGVINVSSGQRIALSSPVISGETGRIGSWITQTWASYDLLINKTYYLRAQITNGSLVLYVTIGTDTDTIPVGKRGTPNASIGGGFDSTVLDALLARIITGSAGTPPMITVLANSAHLSAWGDIGSMASTDLTIDQPFHSYTVVGTNTLNWSRTPNITLRGAAGLNPTITAEDLVSGDLAFGFDGDRYKVQLHFRESRAGDAATFTWLAFA